MANFGGPEEYTTWDGEPVSGERRNVLAGRSDR